MTETTTNTIIEATGMSVACWHEVGSNRVAGMQPTFYDVDLDMFTTTTNEHYCVTVRVQAFAGYKRPNSWDSFEVGDLYDMPVVNAHLYMIPKNGNDVITIADGEGDPVTVDRVLSVAARLVRS